MIQTSTAWQAEPHSWSLDWEGSALVSTQGNDHLNPAVEANRPVTWTEVPRTSIKAEANKNGHTLGSFDAPRAWSLAWDCLALADEPGRDTDSVCLRGDKR